MEIDSEIGIELYDSFTELSQEIELSLEKLSQGNDADLHALFRAVHTIKGNAAIVQLTGVIDFSHALEEVFGALRSKKYSATPTLCEVLQLGMDRLKDLHQREIFQQSFGNLHEEELIELFTQLAASTKSDLEPRCQDILNIIGVGFINDEETEEAEQASDYDTEPTPADHSKQAFDLLFFREIAQQIDRKSPYWEGRSEQSHDWAQKLNVIKGSPVDPNQLSAAVYLHDIGMSFIPSQIIEKEDKLNMEELAQIRQHPVWGYNYLVRIEGWTQAATMILEHHEREDGKGYPIGNRGENTHDGAKILSIIDTFFSITKGRADRKTRKSVVRAVSEINARIGTQFDEDWVLAFNEMIKNELQSGQL